MLKRSHRPLALTATVGLLLALSGCASMSDSDSMESDSEMSDSMSVEETFLELDADGDGYVSREEMLEQDGEVGDFWTVADVNGDDMLSVTEYGVYRNRAPDAME